MTPLKHFKPGAKVKPIPMPLKKYLRFFPNHYLLHPEKTYTVSKVDIGSSYTSVAIEEFPDLAFNVCSFTGIEE